MAIHPPDRLHHSFRLDPLAIVGPGEEFLEWNMERRGIRTLTQDADDCFADHGRETIQVGHSFELHAIPGLHRIRRRG